MYRSIPWTQMRGNYCKFGVDKFDLSDTMRSVVGYREGYSGYEEIHVDSNHENVVRSLVM